jgi:uncharacterized membrane protein HdeD (DUF308 family)
MKDYFKKVKAEYVVQSIVIIAIGIVLIAWAPTVIPLMARILAALLFVVGVLFVLSYLLKKERGFVDSGSFAFGIIVAAVGVWIFLNPVAFTDFIPKIFGAFILLSGIRNLGQTFSLVRYKYGLWWLSLIFALATVGLGAGLIFKASQANELIVRLIGGFLAYDGISNLWTASRLGKVEKAFEAARQEAEAIDVEARIIDEDDSAER